MSKIKISVKTKLKISLTSVIAVLSTPSYLIRAIGYSATILFILQWLFNIQILWAILQTAPKELPTVLIEGYINLFRFGFDLTPVMLVFISVLQGIAFSVMAFIVHTGTKAKTNKGILGMAMLGSGCVTCSGSIIAPLIGLFSSGGTAVLSQWISDAILVFAAGLALYSVITVGEKAASTLRQISE